MTKPENKTMDKQSRTPTVMLAAIVGFGYVSLVSAILAQVIG